MAVDCGGECGGLGALGFDDGDERVDYGDGERGLCDGDKGEGDRDDGRAAGVATEADVAAFRVLQ